MEGVSLQDWMNVSQKPELPSINRSVSKVATSKRDQTGTLVSR